MQLLLPVPVEEASLIVGRSSGSSSRLVSGRADLHHLDGGHQTNFLSIRMDNYFRAGPRDNGASYTLR